MISLLEDRRKERNSLDVVPVRMGEEDVAADSRAVPAGDERASELADARPGIEDDEPVGVRPHFHARGVPAVSHRVRSRSGNRPARAPEPKSQSHEYRASRRDPNGAAGKPIAATRGVTPTA